jgi:hypothetical protein
MQYCGADSEGDGGHVDCKGMVVVEELFWASEKQEMLLLWDVRVTARLSEAYSC